MVSPSSGSHTLHLTSSHHIIKIATPRALSPQIRQTRLMFVPTLYFVDSTGTSHDTGQSRVSHWCYTRDSGGWCPPATPEQTAQFQAGMTKCFKHAVAKGMSLAVTPHVDDGTGSGVRRREKEDGVRGHARVPFFSPQPFSLLPFLSSLHQHPHRHSLSLLSPCLLPLFLQASGAMAWYLTRSPPPPASRTRTSCCTRWRTPSRRPWARPPGCGWPRRARWGRPWCTTRPPTGRSWAP